MQSLSRLLTKRRWREKKEEKVMNVDKKDREITELKAKNKRLGTQLKEMSKVAEQALKGWGDLREVNLKCLEMIKGGYCPSCFEEKMKRECDKVKKKR